MEKKMKKCKTCGKEIAKNAKICPECGAKNPTPIFKKWWFWLIVIVIIVALSSGGDDNKATNQSQNQSNSPAEQKNEEIYKIGDVVNVGDFDYTVLEVSDSNTLGSNPYLQKETENNYVIVKISVKNTGKEAKYIDGEMFELHDANGTVYSADGTLDIYANESGDGFFLEEINPNITKTGFVVFETSVKNLESPFDLEVSGGIISGKSKMISLVE